jgi:hypothetical protein
VGFSPLLWRGRGCGAGEEKGGLRPFAAGVGNDSTQSCIDAAGESGARILGGSLDMERCSWRATASVLIE